MIYKSEIDLLFRTDTAKKRAHINLKDNCGTFFWLFYIFIIIY